MQLSPISPQPKKPVIAPRFGVAPHVAELKGLTRVADQVFKRVTYDRTTEMLLEDFVGFGLLRTWMDLRRGKTYGDEQQNNLPAASERMARETLSILTDNVLAGGVAYAVAKALDGKHKGFSNQFIDFDTLSLFREIAGKLDPDKAKAQATAEEAFLQALQTRLNPEDPAACKRLLQEAWVSGKKAPVKSTFGQSLQNWWHGKQDVKSLQDATKLANAIRPKAESYGWTNALKDGVPRTFKLDSLLDDVSRFSRHMNGTWAAEQAQKAAPCWKTLAESSIKHTLQTKATRIPVAMLAAMGATFAVPFVITELTRKIWGINYYPGEIGLKDKESLEKASGNSSQTFWQRHFPYITESLKNGNPVPFLTTLLPVPLAFGLYDTVNRKMFRGGKRQWLKMFDFQKARPFTAQQQMASVFALLITSRLLNSRTDNEFRERMVDSFAGWGIWILGTPLIKEAVARISDAKWGTKLLKEVNGKRVLRTREEIEHLLLPQLQHLPAKEAKAIADRTLSASARLGIGSTVATMLMLGIVEPWIGIKWTQYNEKRKQAQQAAAQTAKPTALRPVAPVAMSLPATSPAVGQPMVNQFARLGFPPNKGISAAYQWAAQNAQPLANNCQA